MFTFFLYLNDVTEDQSLAGGGATWFPQVKVNSSCVEGEDYWRSKMEMAELDGYYRQCVAPSPSP
jgi:hypothetical protein